MIYLHQQPKHAPRSPLHSCWVLCRSSNAMHPQLHCRCFSNTALAVTTPKRFRPSAGDNTVCPWSFPPPDSQDPGSPGLPAAPTLVDSHVAERTLPAGQMWWEPLMAKFLQSDNPPTPSPPPFRRRGPLRRPVPHSAHHAVFDCRLSASLRLEILGPNPTPHYLFHTDKGSTKLVTFLLASNSLLHPLPPRPDPP